MSELARQLRSWATDPMWFKADVAAMLRAAADELERLTAERDEALEILAVEGDSAGGLVASCQVVAQMLEHLAEKRDEAEDRAERAEAERDHYRQREAALPLDASECRHNLKHALEDVERLTRDVQQAEAENARLKAALEQAEADLREYGRHAEGCSAAVGDYRCKCGWDTVEAALRGEGREGAR